MRNNLVNERIGQINKNKFGSWMVIEKYENNLDIWVRFIEYNYLVHTDYKAFRQGRVRNVYDKSVFGKGYLGEGKYKTWEDKVITKIYITWKSMLSRCYDERFTNKHPTYREVNVCDEWLNFQNFAAWYDENYYEIDGEKVCLDKDILVKGNKIYSPETCVFVPARINLLFVKNNANRRDLPVGVIFNKTTNNYKASGSAGIKGIKKLNNLGFFNTPEEAFQVYKTHKEKLIKEVAEEYKGKIPDKVFQAMMSYIVEIND